jgi:hypothetical protein
MKQLLSFSFLSFIAVLTVVLIVNNECVTLGHQLYTDVSISLGVCEIDGSEQPLSPVAFIVWIVMNIAFAIIYPKSNVGREYKFVAFALGFPVTVFLYLIQKISKRVDEQDKNQA